MSRFVHTYSIVAYDSKTGQYGIGVQSRAFASGAIVPYLERGVGAVATQARADTSYGPLGLNLMRAGKSASEALKGLVAADKQSAVRQVAMIDSEGRVAVHTGELCIAHAGHVIGEEFCVQGNLLASPAVWVEIAATYQNSNGDLSERLLSALEAGQKAGGDIRGMQSAALLVVPGKDDPLGSEYITNLRVDDHSKPLLELRRLLTIQRGNEWASRAVLAVEQKDMEKAAEYYDKLYSLVVGSREPHFWYAAALLLNDQREEGLKVLQQVLVHEPQWVDLLDRLIVAKRLPADDKLIAEIRALVKPETEKTRGKQ